MELDALDHLSDVARTNHGVLWRSHLTAVGLGPREIRHAVAVGQITRIHRDAYWIPGDDPSRSEHFMAKVRAVRARTPDRVVTGLAAVGLLGLPLFGRPSAVHAGTVRGGGSAARSTWAAVKLPPPDQLVVVDGGPTAGAARAVLDTARLHSVVSGVVAADAALAASMTTRQELKEVLGTMAGLTGVARARLCVELADGRSESPGESWSAVVMHVHGIPRPERQKEVFDASGLIGRVDFWWPQWRTAGEFDGRVKYGRVNPSGRPPEDVLWDEKRREDRLRAEGSNVVRWITQDLRHPVDWIARLKAALA